MTRWSGSWLHLGHPVRCVEGTLYRADPQDDDPGYETAVGPCHDCRGFGGDEDGVAQLGAYGAIADRS